MHLPASHWSAHIDIELSALLRCRHQVVDLQMQLDTREEELRLAQKANKREKVVKMANEVWHTVGCWCVCGGGGYL